MKRFNVTHLVLAIMITGAGLSLTSCQDASQMPKDPAVQQSGNVNLGEVIQQHAALFSGCYAVSHDEPAQIKISQQQDKLVMQMKEPKSAKRVWDEPEPLEPMELDQVSKYFSIDDNNISAIIGRPDRLFVLAHVKKAYANINPLLDSPYLGYILQGSNTVYKVECDDTPIGEPTQDPHQNSQSLSNIVIKTAEL